MAEFAGSDHSLIVSEIEGVCSIRVSKTSLGISKARTYEMNVEILQDGDVDNIKDIDANQFTVKNNNRIDVGRDVNHFSAITNAEFLRIQQEMIS
jgi:hypothetical protein